MSAATEARSVRDGDGVLPALRALDVIPLRLESGATEFLVQDALQLSGRGLRISPAGCFVLLHLNGHVHVAELRQAFRRQFGAELPVGQLDALLTALDEALLLRNDRSHRAFQQLREAFLNAPVRDNRERWPDAAGLRRELDAVLAAGRYEGGAPLLGVIAPHLDYRRGFPCYADAYAALRSAGPADRYVILGTNHFGSGTGITATGKDFLTPLGQVANDRSFLEALEARCGGSLREHEFDHAREHSIELQVHLLQAAFPKKPFRIVAVLCPDPCGPPGWAPNDGRGVELDGFADALRTQVEAEPDTRTVLIASADLSHVGERFGDSAPCTDDFLEGVARHDEQAIDLLAGGRLDEFVGAIRARENHARICSAGCLYVLRRALHGAQCCCLRYWQAIDHEAQTHVTCAAGVLTRNATTA